MKFGFSTNAFREYGLMETIDILDDIGYDGVELLLDQPHLYPPDVSDDEIKEIRDFIRKNHIAISNCNAFMLTAIESFVHPSFIEPDPDYRRKRVNHTLNSLDTAAALGATQISIEPGGPVPENKSTEWSLNTFEVGLREVLEKAENVGVDVLVEPEPDLLIETSDQFLEIADRIDSPRLQCNFDVGHFFCVNEDPIDLVSKLEDYTPHYHLEDIPPDRTHEHTQLGQGGIDIDGFLETLDNRGFDGFVTVELYPYQESAEETAQKAMDYLKDHGWI